MRKLIPGTKNFYAGDDNQIYDSEGVPRKQYVNGDGYKTASVLLEDGRWVTFGVQRLVAMAFKKTDVPFALLTVNHIDKVKWNNTPPNLEWVSNKHNVIHAILLNKKSLRPLISCEKDNESFFLADIYDAVIHFDSDVESVWGAIRDGKEIDGWKISYIKASDKRNQRIIVKAPKERSGHERPLTMMDVETGNIKEFSSIKEAASHFSVLITHIRIRISTPGYPKVFRGRYVFVDKGESFDFLNEEVLARLKRTAPKQVLAYNLETSTFRTYDSARSFIQNNKLSKKAVSMRLKKEKLESVSGWLFKYQTANPDSDKKALLEMARSLLV